MTIHIEPCDDATRITPILRILRNSIPEDVFRARLKCALKTGYNTMIATAPNGAQGCLGYRISHDVCWGKTFYIDDLVVQSDARGQGIGAALIEAAKSKAHALNCDHIRLCSGLTRADAHRFYEHNGFQKSSLQFSYALPDGEN